ncbi:MAG: PKD domain-containing protein [Bacteroidetes bacterium]|nr:PKD domain-containing protein [Bacteroidota bacterium]
MNKIFTTLIASLSFFTSQLHASVPPVAQFNASSYSGCAPLTVTFYNSSSGNGSYNWTFGDPGSGPADSSQACSPTHTFINPGTYTVTMNYFLNNTTYTATATITVYPKPNPSIAGMDTICDGSTTTYTASGMTGSGFFWTINGGTIVGPNNNNTVSVLWPTPGTGSLTVTETTVNGCSNSKTINVLVASQPRIGNFCHQTGGSSGNQPDKDRKDCLCAFNLNTLFAIDNTSQLFNPALYNFQWTVTGSGSLFSGQGTNTAVIQVGAGPTVTVTLVVWNDFGCTDTQTCIFDVCPSPTASFKADTACQGGTTHFNASASTILSQLTTFNWDFGDYSTATTTTPITSHLYATPGIYTVKLRVKNASGCTDDTTIKVLVNSGTPPPILCPGTVCHNTKHCYSTPYYPGATYTWTVTGEDTFALSSNDTGICVTWGDGPLGNITLVVTGGPYSCGYNSIDIPIFPKDLEITGPDTVCSGATVNYQVPLIPGSCYSWMPVNPNIQVSSNAGNQISVQVPFNFVGTFNIIADVRNEITCCDGKDTFTVVVQGPIVLDTIQAVCEYSTQTYTANVPVTWTVYNGTINASSPTSINITWGGASIGTIHAAAINPNLVCNNTIVAQVQLVPLPPNPAINGPTMVCVGKPANYNYITSPAIAGSNWSITPFASHTPINNTDNVVFATPGNYTITVNYFNINYNNSGTFNCYSTSVLNVLVVDTLCPVISGLGNTCIGSTQTYTLSSNPGGIWQWQIIGGQIISSTPTSITIQWGNINQGQVNIQNSLCSGFCSKLVNINAIPVGLIVVSDSTCKGDSVKLTGPPGYTYSWNTGATTQSIWATSTGLYSLAITQLGCTATLNYNLNPMPKKPKPNVYLNYNCMIAPNTPIPFQIMATQNPNWSYSWSPQTAIPANSDTNYLHYTTVQNSTHTVIVTNQFGCKDTASITVTGPCIDTVICLNPPCPPPCTCNATYTVNYNPCTGYFSITPITGGPYSGYYWNFGDGDYSNYASPQHWFSTTGNHTVTVAVWCGCNWVSQTVVINVPYIIRPRLKHSFPFSCNYNTIKLEYKTGASTVLGVGLSYQINWGDGPTTSISGLPQNHTYTSAGTYIISYTVNAVSPPCSKTVYDTVTILPFQADFGFCDSGCVGQAVQFYDKSTSWSPIVGWYWTFGDGFNSNLQSPFHIYNAVGPYTVTLVITNFQGCKDTVSYTINITTFNAGTLAFTVNGSPATGNVFKICDGGFVTATAANVPSWTYSWNNGAFIYKDTFRTSGVYYVVIANGDGCTDTLGPFTVIVNPNPNATILAADSVCATGNLTLNALNGLGYSYNWNINNGAFTDTFNPSTFYSLPAGAYNVVLTITNAFGCKAADTANMILMPVPVVTVSPNFIAFCQGNTAALTATVTGSYLNPIQWNNGDTGMTTVAYTQGLYTATATDWFGCVGSGSSYVVVNPLPDLSNIPKGCYKICKNQGPVKVCGPIPLLGEAFNYNWTQNGNPFSTNQSVAITANGTYQLIVTNTITGCTDTSDIFDIQFVPGPSAVIGSPTPNPTICKGSQACITIVVQNPDPDIIYNWYVDGDPLPIETSDTIIICTPGIYILEAFKSNCCKAYDTIIIEEGDCCFDVKDPNFHLIQDSTVYTTTQWWDGKYYVAGRVYVRNKAVLDMTTIDVVFDRDGEIIFEDSSVIRANNSVFRPCDMHDVWVGFTFKDSSSGFIHSNTYKNAKHAIDVNTKGPEGVKITDNVFTDCHIGVRINRGSRIYNQGITNNSFVISDYDFTINTLYPNYDYFGIKLESVRMDEIVSQNQFRNSDRTQQNNKFYGIYMLRSLANLSENKFTNMYRSFDVVSNIGLVNIENNEIEKDFQGKFPSDVQIRLTNCTLPTLIYANELRNSDNKWARTTGIYADVMNGMNIRDNNIKGFDIGIWTRRTTNSVVNENDIDLSGDIGILDTASKNIDINCNIVRMKDCVVKFPNTCNAIGIYMQQGDSMNDIYTNCVFDTRRAIMVQRMTGTATIPRIVNNYLYNYQYAGVASINHFGDIGGVGRDGRNTFTSNNAGGGAFDITAVGGIVNQRCNFGIIQTAGTVNSNPCPGLTMYNSSAACGHQIVNPKYYKLNQWDICDQYFGKSAIIIIEHDGGHDWGVDKGKIATIQLATLQKQEVMLVAMVLSEEKDKNNFDLWMNRIRNEKLLTSFEIHWLECQWNYDNASTNVAIQKLSSFAVANEEEQQQKDIWMTIWNAEISDRIDAAAFANMALIDNSNTSQSSLARDVMQSANGDKDHKFAVPFVEPEPEIAGNLNDAFIHLIPNPASEKVNVEFRIKGSGEAQVNLYDAVGNKIDRQAMQLTQGRYQFDLRNLSPGLYLVSVLDTETQEKHVAKLIVE